MSDNIEVTARLNASDIRKMIFRKSINGDGIEIQLSNPTLTYSKSFYRIRNEEFKNLIDFLNQLNITAKDSNY